MFMCKVAAFTSLKWNHFYSKRAVYTATQRIFWGLGKKVVVFGVKARFIVICITSINSSTRRVLLNENVTPSQNCMCSFEFKENGSNGCSCSCFVHFHFYLFDHFGCFPRNSNVCIHILNAHCFQWGLFISVSCFLAIYIGRKRVCFARNCISMNYKPTNESDAKARDECWGRDSICYHLRNLKSLQKHRPYLVCHRTPGTGWTAKNTVVPCQRVQMSVVLLRIHWFDISFGRISVVFLLVLNCANGFEPYFIWRVFQSSHICERAPTIK